MKKAHVLFSALCISLAALSSNALAQSDDDGDDGDEGSGQSQDQALLEGKALFKEAADKVFNGCPAADPKTGKFNLEDRGTMTIRIPHKTGEVHIDRSSITGYPSVAARDCAFSIISQIKIKPWKGKNAKFNFTVRWALPKKK